MASFFGTDTEGPAAGEEASCAASALFPLQHSFFVLCPCQRVWVEHWRGSILLLVEVDGMRMSRKSLLEVSMTSYETMTPTGSWRTRHTKKVECYRDCYTTRHGITFSCFPCAMATSGRIQGEFLRLNNNQCLLVHKSCILFLYILNHCSTTRYFASLGDDDLRVDSFTCSSGNIGPSLG